MKRQGHTGIGLMIMFITFLLLAAIAAGVMIITSNNYNEKTITTSKDALRESGNTINIIEIIAKDGRNANIEQIYISLKTGPDSESIALNNTMVFMSLTNKSKEYVFSKEIDCDDPSTFSDGSFGLVHLIKGAQHLEYRLNKGDVATICFFTPRKVAPSENIKINLIPLKGTPVFFEHIMPDVIYREKVVLYP